MKLHDKMQVANKFAYVSFSVFVCPSVLTMSFLALCADSACLPGMLTCHAVLLSLLKKSGKVFITLFPRFPPPWPAPLRHQVFDAIKIVMSLVVCFLQSQFHHRWQNHGAVFITKIKPESPRSSDGVLSLNTPCSTAPNSGHYIKKLLLKEPFEPLSTWSSKWMVMVNSNREVCPAMNYL
jgi:hypothetical protein